MDIGSFFIGIAGIAVAALSLWLTYKEKTSLYRERLYSKQLEVYPEVVRAHVLLDGAMRSVTTHFLLFAKRHSEQDERWLHDSVREASRQWRVSQDIYECSLPVLSREFAEKIQRYDTWAAKAIEQADTTSQDQHQELGDAYLGRCISEGVTLHTDVLQAARKDLGTDPLTQEALKLIGEMKLKNQQ